MKNIVVLQLFNFAVESNKSKEVNQIQICVSASVFQTLSI
jgi:hypothetical protein